MRPPFARVHGVLSDGRPLDCALSGDEWVGRQAGERGEWWVKARLADGELLLSRGEGYAVENVQVAEEVAEAMLRRRVAEEVRATGAG
jgi:hypothetical protein